MLEHCFIRFEHDINLAHLPQSLNDPFGNEISLISRQAAQELQTYLLATQDEWQHDFDAKLDQPAAGKGKMFGVLVVQNNDGDYGYLCAYSGKLNKGESPKRFVPSLFKLERDGAFLNEGMTALSEMSAKIKSLNVVTDAEEIKAMKLRRAQKSTTLQAELFTKYRFYNSAGEHKSLPDIFEQYSNSSPASGAGECAAPKLFDYAFRHALKPMAIAEFWWGESNVSQGKKHGEFYPACLDKCKPILSFMLEDLRID